jgi:hypothetical protein
MIRQFLIVSSFSVLALGLTGCESMKAVKDKVASIEMPSLWSDDKIEQDADGIVMAANEGCPQVAVVDDLKMLSQFETPASPTPETNISSVNITGMKSSCTVGANNTVAVNIGLRFDGALGPKASAWNSESHNFAYPYFVAVTTPTGEILSKEVFAATLRYENGETAISQEESMRQVIPLKDVADASGYEILIGFQLTNEELAYNRTQPRRPVDDLAAPAVAAAPVATTQTAAAEPTPITATQPLNPDVQAPAEQPIPTTTDSDMKAAVPDVMKSDTPEPPAQAAEAVPASQSEAAAAIAPAAAPAATDPAAANAPAPVAMPAPAPMSPPEQIIKIKADGSIETQKR